MKLFHLVKIFHPLFHTNEKRLKIYLERDAINRQNVHTTAKFLASILIHTILL